MSFPRMSRSFSAFSARLALALLAILAVDTTAEAQRSSRRLLRDSSEILARLDPTTTVASRSVCVLRKGRDACSYGVVVHPDGWLVSKFSELVGEELTCELPNGWHVEARIAAVDRQHDLALLRVDSKELVPVRWSAATLPVGSLVVTGGPRSRAVAMGVVSGPVRALEPGDPMLGVEFDLRRLEPRVRRVIQGTAAQLIGLRERDLIVGVNNKNIRTREQLMSELQGLRVGDEIALVVSREGEELSFAATLGTWTEEGTMDGEKSRVRSGFPEVFRHDCVLEPEECGGPLVDLEGNVVGLNIARAGRTASYAIPGSRVQAVVRGLLREAERGEIARREDH